MASFTYNINLGIFGDNRLNGLIAQLDRTESSLDRVQNSVLEVGNEVKKTAGKAQSSFSNMTGGLNGLIARLGVAAVAWKSLTTTADIESAERAITFASGKEGAKNVGFVRDEVSRLNVDLMGALQGYKTLQGSLMGTGLEGVGQDLFKGMAEASAALGMPREAFELSLKAFGQMASKGTVMSEELKLQLGDHLPGALNIASRAMGVTTGKLMKMMENGEVVSSVFLPRMAAELHKTFGSVAVENVDSARANLNLFNNTLNETYDVLGRELLPIATNFLKDFLIPGAKWLGENKEQIGALVKGTAALWVTLKAFTIANWVVRAFGTVSTIMGVNTALAGTSAAIGGIGTSLTALGGPLAILAGLIMYTDHLARTTDKLDFLKWNKIGLAGDVDKRKSAKKVGMALLTEGLSDKSRGDRGYGISKMLLGNNNQSIGPLASGLNTLFVKKESPKQTQTEELSKEARKGISGINEGGRSVKNITVNIQDLIGIQHLQTSSLEKSLPEMEEMMLRKLTQILNSSTQIQTN